MRPTDPSEPLHVEIDTRHFHPGDLSGSKADLDALTRMVEHFPRPELHVLVEHMPRNDEYVVKTSLILPGQTLVASEQGPAAHAAYEHCIHVLMDQVKEYKDRLGHVPERQKEVKGTYHPLEPTVDQDIETVNAAVVAGDYAAFRASLQDYEEPLRERVGRWLERTAGADGKVGRNFTIADLVEEVFLDAFEGYDRRPREVRFGDWLDGLIDPALKELLRHPDEELENVGLIRSMRDVPVTQEEH